MKDMNFNRKNYGRLSSYILVFFILFISFLSFLSCQSTPKKELQFQNQTGEIETDETEVFFASGDTLEIKFFYNPELNTIQTIRPDGKIDLQLIGEVTARGKSPEELKEELIKSYSKHIRQLDISIAVQSFSNRRVYVGGQVNDPGSIPMPGKLTVLEALMLAGGIDVESGGYKDVLLIRYENGQWTGGKINMGKIFNGESTLPVYLKPLDIVFVPEKKISRVNRWVDQHLTDILPVFGLSYTINPDGPNMLGISTTLNPRD